MRFLLAALQLTALPRLAASIRGSTPELEELPDLEEDEFEAAVDKKCTPNFGPSASSLLALESLGEARSFAVQKGGSVGAAQTTGSGEVEYVDHKCTREEMADFYTRFGLTGGGALSQRSFSNKAACPSNNVVWLYPTADTNSFTLNPNVCFRLREWSGVACSVHVQRVRSTKEALGFLKTFGEGSIMHLVIGGHGDGQALRLGEGPNLFGVTRDLEGGVPVGRIVSWKDFIMSEGTSKNPNGMFLPPGTLGYVLDVDDKGLVRVMFGSSFEMQKLSKDKFLSHEVHEDSANLALLAGIKAVMQQQGSIFMDSCLSAHPAKSPNLANFVALHVGKGVRVVGSTESFQQVNVESFQPWHAAIHTSKARHTERTYVATCPSAGAHELPDAEGNCACPAPKLCRTEAGKDCPVAGTKPKTHFLPVCFESWALDKCTCVDTSATAAQSPPAAAAAVVRQPAAAAQPAAVVRQPVPPVRPVAPVGQPSLAAPTHQYVFAGTTASRPGVVAPPVVRYVAAGAVSRPVLAVPRG